MLDKDRKQHLTKDFYRLVVTNIACVITTQLYRLQNGNNYRIFE